MAREIKFRAWDNNRKSTYLVSGFSFEANKCSLNADNGQHWIVELSEVELMQFTGLKDKNGKEIYEGDILEWDSTGSGDENEITQVKWSEDKVMFTSDDEPLYFETLEEIEVIGNIYENPELLTEKK